MSGRRFWPFRIRKVNSLTAYRGLPVAAKFEGQVKADDQIGLSGRIGYMAQQDLLLEWATVRDNIALGSRLRGEACPPERLYDIICAVGLNDKAESDRVSYQEVNVSVLHWLAPYWKTGGYFA